MNMNAGVGLLQGARRGSRWTILVLLVALVPLLTGCYGAFPLTHKIYQFNGEVSKDKWVKSIVMWVFVIIPVYGVGTFADAIIFNLVEFWTGKALLATTSVDSNGNTVALTPADNGRDAVLTISRDGQVIAERHFVKISDTTFEVCDANGLLCGKVVRDASGTMQLTDSHGTVVRALTPDTMGTALIN